MSEKIRQLAELHQAALKAMELTNLCTKHMEYHGQKYEDCTPEKRVMIELKQEIESHE